MAGSITAYSTAAGKRYRVRYRKPDKSQTDKRGFRTKKEAELFLASVTVSKATGDYIDPALGRVTVEGIAPGWLAGKKASLKPSTYAPMHSAWQKHVRPTWGSREVSRITPSEIQQWVSELAVGRSATTVKRAHGVLSGILDTAVLDRRINRNPAKGTSTPRKKSKARVYLAHEQVRDFAAASAHPDLVLFLAYTGLRWGEATGLRVRSIDFVRRRVTVSENAVLVGSTVHVGTPKTHEARSVPFPKFLRPALTKLAEGKRPDQLLFGNGDHHLRAPKSKTGWFQSAVARVQAAEQHAADKARERGKKHPGVTFPRITPHDLRHTAASLAISSGANVKAVQRMLGHASAAMTLDTYADLFDDDLDMVAARLDKKAVAADVAKVWRTA
ncbi:tyrosine-type recombinase/integrase [Microbacterium esteraromaticum]|uniref:tyrosine-type recombinase/integrase n=1 Tax=Microbacterium esteraromaticum TaxID=57043 RepID=UPI0019D3343F|nr:tyrosine-type recombinase/integrase [Microbacterium esteraromaticum]MBN7792390.1 site-specific integrase [Microbacterium esteraromaticum]